MSRGLTAMDLKTDTLKQKKIGKHGHDPLLTTTLKKYAKVRGMIMKSQLYVRDCDIVRSSSDMIQSENDALHVVNALRKRDSLAVLSTVYSYFNNLVNC